MIDERKFKAIALRTQGFSIKEIAHQMDAAQSSVSIWTREVVLTPEQIAKLKANTHTRQVIEKRRLSRLKTEETKRQAVIIPASREVGQISGRELWLIGVALYWAEGGKTQNTTRFSNGDPKMIQLMLRFFQEICGVENARIRGHIHIHESLDLHAAELYWQTITGLPREQFYKTYNKPNISSKGLRHSLPYGVFDIYVSKPGLFLKIRGWTKGIYDSTLKMI